MQASRAHTRLAGVSRRSVLLFALVGAALLVLVTILLLADEEVSSDRGGGLVEGASPDSGLAGNLDRVEERDHAGGVIAPTSQDRIERVGSGIERTELTGRVTDRAGHPIPAATVIAFHSEPGLPFRTRTDTGHMDLTDAEGRFMIRGLPADAPLGLDLSATGHAPALVEPLTLSVAEPRDLGDLVLGAGLALEGRVFDAITGAAIVGARLVLTDLTTEHRRGGPSESLAETHSDDDGHYRFEHLAMRQYGVDAASDGYAPVTSVTTFVLTGPTRSVTQDFALEPTTSSLAGHVVGPSNGPVPGARLRLSRAPRRRNTFFLEHIETDKTGGFLFPALPEGRFDLDLVSEHWYLPSKLAVDSGDTQLVIRAQPTLSVAGQLVVSSGSVPTDFDVTVKPDGRTGASLSSGVLPRLSVEDADPPGTFLFAGLRPGSYAFEIDASGFAHTRSQDVLLGRDSDPDRPTEVVVPLTRGGTFVGVLDPPSARVPVEVRGMDYDPSLTVESTFPTMPLAGLVTQTDREGAFRLDHVPEGEYVLTARPSSGPPLHVRGVRALEGTEIDVGTLHLQQGGKVGGVVRGPDGRPRQGARVTAMGDEHQQQAVTDGQGTYILASLPAGEYEVRATPGELWEALRLEAQGHASVHPNQDVELDLQLVERTPPSR